MATKGRGVEEHRRSRSHPKSRSGCGNCKVRKIKCDERKHMCKRCEAYGTSCNYDAKESAFQSVTRGHGYFHTLKPPPSSEKRLILNIINGAPNLKQVCSPQLHHGSEQFSMQHLELLNNFHTRTILTVGIGKSNPVYRDAYVKLTYSVRPDRSLLLPAAY